ncbi:peptidase C39 [Paraburkholderia sp. C35]|uniref:peptidase C39 n=1 Tax=Paraburkholderia sp. C35 TaxID=2126993 RepID=UPI000D696DD2|nr:peptidase C39 [Paraburkholderia sp. C35]
MKHALNPPRLTLTATLIALTGGLATSAHAADASAPRDVAPVAIQWQSVGDDVLAQQTGKGAGGQMISGFVLNVLSQWQLPNGANALAQGTLSVATNAANALTASVSTLASVTDGRGNTGANPGAQVNGGQSISVNGVSQITQVAGDRNAGFNTATIDFNNNPQLLTGGTNAQSASASNGAGNIKAGISFGNGGVTIALQTPAGLASQTIAPSNAQQAGAIAQLLQIAGNNQQVANQLQLSLQTAPMSSGMLRQAGVLQALQNAINARR